MSHRNMLLQIRARRSFVRTKLTFKRFLARMCPNVGRQRRRLGTFIRTERAFKRFLARVASNVQAHVNRGEGVVLAGEAHEAVRRVPTRHKLTRFAVVQKFRTGH